MQIHKCVRELSVSVTHNMLATKETAIFYQAHDDKIPATSSTVLQRSCLILFSQVSPHTRSETQPHQQNLLIFEHQI